MKKLCINSHKFTGIEASRQANQKNRSEGKPLIDPESIPGVVEGGWVEEDYQILEKQKERCLTLTCQNIIDTFKRHKCSWPFHEPVSKDDVPDYDEKIKEPMDIKTIEKKLQTNLYSDKDQFIRDMKLIFSNCKEYNQPETLYYKNAEIMEEYI